ncbi:hypothetical protein Droror1_Dr00018359 [Drosera rotundifolia]
MGTRNVLVKGGDLLVEMSAVDVFFDGKNFYELSCKHIHTRNTHGTGCSLESCIAVELANGSSVNDSDEELGAATEKGPPIERFSEHVLEYFSNYTTPFLVTWAYYEKRISSLV